MHKNNKLWLSDVKKKYPKSFSKSKVLELGSGTTSELVIRSYFKKCNYTGVDIVGKDQGVKGVDVIAEAGSTKFKKNYFDTLVCFSMLEHDPNWKKSVSHNIQFLKNGALIIFSFGSNGNRRHDPEPWGEVEYDDFIKYCNRLPIKIIDAFFEEERYGYDCAGAFNMIAIKSKTRGKYDYHKINLVKQKPMHSRAFDDLLYVINRTRRNAKIILKKNKYFYNEG